MNNNFGKAAKITTSYTTCHEQWNTVKSAKLKKILKMVQGLQIYTQQNEAHRYDQNKNQSKIFLAFQLFYQTS